VVTGAGSALARVARRVEEAAVVLDVRGLDVSFTSDFFAALDVRLFLGTIIFTTATHKKKSNSLITRSGKRKHSKTKQMLTKTNT
jgi:hypothetical protein